MSGTQSGGTGADGFRRPTGRDQAAVITSARTSTSSELRGREVRYAITMGFRTLCFIAMIFVSGPFRWVLLGCAIFLPGVAVLFANQANQRGRTAKPVASTTPTIDAPQLTVGGEVIESDVDDAWDPKARRGDQHGNGQHRGPEHRGDEDVRDDRVA